MIGNEHESRGDSVEIIEAPLWQFDELDFTSFQVDRLYIPHRELITWKNHSVPKHAELVFYMQSVFPERFYVDLQGFAGGASFYPIKEPELSIGDEYGPWFDKLAARGSAGISKFDQPSMGAWNPDFKYHLFACQIPHDQTILYHSDVKVEEALERLLKDMAVLSPAMKVVVKGHPVNPGSMAELKKITLNHPNGVWIENFNIHDVIEKAEAVHVVNSGTGMEALLHKKTVYTYGRCEYDIITNQPFSEKRARQFFDYWCQKLTYDSTDPESFKKLP
jgi:hypothetical protein